MSIDYSTVKVRSYDNVAHVASKVNKVRQTAAQGPIPIEKRKDLLRNLYYAVVDNSEALCLALQKDLHRAHSETKLLELGGILAEIKTALDNVDNWAKPVSTAFDIKYAASSPKLVPEPYGLVLVIGPWNYPYLCLAAPIVNAIAAGNCIVSKPSEMVPHASEVLSRVLESALDPEYYTTITGSIPETTELLKQKFDKICFTGSPGVGRVVSRAAAEHLTPCLLELGGKCPVVIDKTANIALAAKRITWGKLVNSGQTCIAPDYILVEESVKDEFIKELKAAIKRSYPNLSKESSDFAHIVSERLWDRAQGLISKTKGVKELEWGTPDRDSLFYPPTVVSNVSLDDALMQEELFGPILPIVTIRSAREVVPLIKKHDTPLAFYIFSSNKKLIDELSVVRSGALFVNDTVMHGGSACIPFGGIGESGSGSYHGKFGFDAFSHPRPVLSQPGYLETLLSVRYPPYTPTKKNIVNKAYIPPGVWWSRTGAVKPSIIRRLVGKSWIIILIVAFLYVKSRL